MAPVSVLALALASKAERRAWQVRQGPGSGTRSAAQRKRGAAPVAEAIGGVAASAVGAVAELIAWPPQQA